MKACHKQVINEVFFHRLKNFKGMIITVIKFKVKGHS